MNISSDPTRGAGGRASLLGRVRQAHAREVDQSEGPDESEETSARETSLDGAEETLKRDAESPLERRMIECAGDVLEGRVESPEEVRSTVLEAIVDAKYDGIADGEAGADMMAVLEASLTDDPSFRAEVENMLIHAARRLGRVKGG